LYLLYYPTNLKEKLYIILYKFNKMGLLNLMYLEAEKVYGCARCKVHLTEINEIISKVSQLLI